MHAMPRDGVVGGGATAVAITSSTLLASELEQASKQTHPPKPRRAFAFIFIPLNAFSFQHKGSPGKRIAAGRHRHHANSRTSHQFLKQKYTPSQTSLRKREQQ
jgi:hypothetical protein